MVNRRDAIVGTVAGYTLDQIRNFVLSFREHNQKARIIFIVDYETKTSLQTFFDLHGIETVVFSSFRFTETFVHNNRWIAIFDYIQNIGISQFKNILLTDVRDVVFQSDPFVDLPDNYLYYFTEDNGVSIGAQEFNVRWVRSVYDDEILNQVKDLPILCLGTVLGSSDRIYNYLTFVYHELVRVRYQKFDLFKTDILDQAFGIYAAYCVYKNTVEIKPNGNIVGTIALSMLHPDKKDIITLHMGQVQVNGVVPAIIHQYDRNPIISDFFNKKYLINHPIN